MNPERFEADILARPLSYRRLAVSLRDQRPALPRPSSAVLLLGMGSSRYAASVVARHLQALGIAAIADFASALVGLPPTTDVLLLAISASGESAETLAALERYRGKAPLIAVTNNADSAIARACNGVIQLEAGEELGGVACRSFSHTIAVLLHLACEWGADWLDVPKSLEQAAIAVADLIDRRDKWLPAVADALSGPNGTWLLAPAERLGSAEQGALMLREGPRRAAVACETGDWSHVDVYLTRTLDYRAVMFAGSRWDYQALDWLRSRSATWVGVGADLDGSSATVRYPYDDDPIVALLTEVVVAELVAAHLWQTQA